MEKKGLKVLIPLMILGVILSIIFVSYYVLTVWVESQYSAEDYWDNIKDWIRYENVSGTISHVEYVSKYGMDDYVLLVWDNGYDDIFDRSSYAELKNVEGKNVVIDIMYNQATTGYFHVEHIEIM